MQETEALKRFNIWKQKVGAAAEMSQERDVNELFERLYSQYADDVLRVAYFYLSDRQKAEDVCQDVFLRLLTRTPDIQEGHEKAWLLCVASNLCKNKLSYNKIRETDELLETLTAEEREDLSFVWNAVKKLPEKYREAIHLYYEEGYSTREISRILNRRESTVRSDLKRGRERLKEILKEEYDFA